MDPHAKQLSHTASNFSEVYKMKGYDGYVARLRDRESLGAVRRSPRAPSRPARLSPKPTGLPRPPQSPCTEGAATNTSLLAECVCGTIDVTHVEGDSEGRAVGPPVRVVCTEEVEDLIDSLQLAGPCGKRDTAAALLSNCNIAEAVRATAPPDRLGRLRKAARALRTRRARGSMGIRRRVPGGVVEHGSVFGPRRTTRSTRAGGRRRTRRRRRRSRHPRRLRHPRPRHPRRLWRR
jgi:hypothetical protein